MKPREDLSGRKFNKITAIKPAPDRILPNGRHLTMWNCVCDCGNTLTIRASDLKSGNVISCGCYRAKNTGEVHRTHGATTGRKATQLYQVWANMLARCKNKKAWAYKYYGAKGVRVCDEWKDYAEFEKWATENGYAPGLSIDRIDVNGNYCPENCRWATATQQANNQTKNRRIEAFGSARTIAEWACELKIPYDRLYYLLSKNGWSIERAVMVT